jgi:hypothetical protein
MPTRRRKGTQKQNGGILVGLIGGSGAKEPDQAHRRLLRSSTRCNRTRLAALNPFWNSGTLIGEKTQLRTAELACADSHLARLREGRPESTETSSLHLDVLRDLKRIHSHICSVAYPVLDAAGELHSNRLRDVVAGGNNTAASNVPPFPAQSS